MKLPIAPVLCRKHVRTISSLALAAMVISGVHAVAQDSAGRTLPVHLPLRISTTETVPLHVGHAFHGQLLEPVYGPDRLLLPEGTQVTGVIAATPAADRATRINAKLDGDFTPLRDPVLRVTELRLPSGVTLQVQAEGGLRNAAVISLARPQGSESLWRRTRSLMQGQVKQARESVESARQEPHKSDRLKQMLYHQLPYHPQRVWAGSAFDAMLQSPLTVPASAARTPMPHATAVDLTQGTLQARLVSGVSSASSKRKDAVTAVLTRPFCDPQGRVMLPAGTQLTGQVLVAEPARRLARNGKLRFAFRSVAVPPSPDQIAAARAPEPGPAQQVTATDTQPHHPPRLTERPATVEQRIQGNLTSVQANPGENIALDPEGGAHAQPDKGRFLAPLVLGVMAAASQDEDGGIGRQAVTSNGFGVMARIVTAAAASRNASTGFAAFAFSKSIYRRYIARGHEVTFPTNTEMTIALGR